MMAQKGIDQIFSIYRVKRSLSPCNQTDSKCDEKKNFKDQNKITRFWGFIHIYSTNIHFVFVTEVQFTDRSSNSS